MLQVGPESAGAHPGPVCYRKPGGLPALTDANLALGRILPVCSGASEPSALAILTPRCFLCCNKANASITIKVPTAAQEFFPHIFGPSEDQPLDAEAARAALTALAKDVNASTPAGQAQKSVDEVMLPLLWLGSVL